MSYSEMEKKRKPLLLDIMIDGRFCCQLKYDGSRFPLILKDGTLTESVDVLDIRRFVEQERPSLKGKKYRIEFASQRV